MHRRPDPILDAGAAGAERSVHALLRAPLGYEVAGGLALSELRFTTLIIHLYLDRLQSRLVMTQLH
jgi:hypothetical protein